MKILVTGFDPFNNDIINPSIEAVRLLPNFINEVEIIKIEVPTVFFKSLNIIEEAIIKYQPDVILSIGQAGGRSDISIERIGINIDDAKIVDNENNQIIDDKIFVDGPDAYFTTLPIKAMVENIKKYGIPSSISNSAGTFVCNHVTYGVAHLLATKYANKRSGFIHIPYLPSQTLMFSNVASMELNTIVKAIICAIHAIIENENDIKVTGGKLH